MTAPLIINDPDARAIGLARALSARCVCSGGKVARLIFPGRKSRQFTLLYGAGFSAVRRGPAVLFVRPDVGGAPINLYKALAVAKALAEIIPSGGNFEVDGEGCGGDTTGQSDTP